MMRFLGKLLLTYFLAGTTFAATPIATASIAYSSTYLLPDPFFSNDTSVFLATQATGFNTSAQEQYAVSYSSEFDSLIANATLEQVIKVDSNTAYEAGIWEPVNNQVWYTSNINKGPTFVSILDLNTSTVFNPNLTVVNPNGGYYHNGLVYFASLGNASTATGVVSIDPQTYEMTKIVNSYFGLRFSAVDDVVIACPNFMYFSSTNFAAFGLTPAIQTGIMVTGNVTQQLPSSFWLFDGSRLQPVITKNEVLTPNGVAIDPKNSYLYVTDTSSAQYGAPADSIGTASIWRYDINSTNGQLSNRILFGLARAGIPDGIKVDDSGRVWTGEGEGIVVRDSDGKVLGSFNVRAIMEIGGTPDEVTPIANFAFAGNKLVILALNSVQIVDLGFMLAHPARYQC